MTFPWRSDSCRVQLNLWIVFPRNPTSGVSSGFLGLAEFILTFRRFCFRLPLYLVKAAGFSCFVGRNCTQSLEGVVGCEMFWFQLFAKVPPIWSFMFYKVLHLSWTWKLVFYMHQGDIILKIWLIGIKELHLARNWSHFKWVCLCDLQLFKVLYNLKT